MSVSGYLQSQGGRETWERFDGGLTTGGALIGAPTFDAGVDGKALSMSQDQGATILTTAEVSRGYPVTATVWFAYTTGGKSVPVFQWGTTPAMAAILHGAGSSEQPGTLEAQVRMSNGRYALRVRTGVLAPNRWHCLVISVGQTTLWGGARATAYIDGQNFGSGSYNGSLFDIVNFDRQRLVTIGAGAGALRVDEFAAFESEWSGAQAAALYGAADSLDTGAQSGFGIVF